MSGVLDRLSNGELTLDTQEEFDVFWRSLTSMEQRELAEASKHMRGAGPIEGPQRKAFNTPAKILGYGGGAGGGKSGLICLLALVAHERTVCFRNDAKQMAGMVDDLVSFAGTSAGLNRQASVFRFTDRPNHLFEWGGLGKPGSETIWRGRPHDLLAADEITEIQQRKLDFVRTWCRTTTPGQRCRVVYTFNPPGRADEATGLTGDNGAWVRDYFGAWVDPRHKNPAFPGEIRYYVKNPYGEEEERPDSTPEIMELKGQTFEAVPESRTFIPALVGDNPYLNDEYLQTLLSLDEPLRSQMLLGDFSAGMEDSEWQVIPTSWIDEAMDRWSPEGKRTRMTEMGVDVARGGSASTILARRHGFWWDRLVKVPGAQTKTGHDVVKLVMDHMRDQCEISIDMTAVGSSPYDLMSSAGYPVNGVRGAVQKGLAMLDAKFPIYNRRSWLYWLLRKVLDPANGLEPSLPRDKRLKSQLMAPRFSYVTGKLQVETKDDVKDRLGYSPDESDAVALSCYGILDEIGAHRLRPTGPSVDLAYLNRVSEYREFRGRRGSGWMVA